MNGQKHSGRKCFLFVSHLIEANRDTGRGIGLFRIAQIKGFLFASLGHSVGATLPFVI